MLKFALLLTVFSLSAFAEPTRLVSVDAHDYSYTGTWSFQNEKGADLSNRKTNNFKFNVNYAQLIEEYPQLMWKAAIFLDRSEVDFGDSDTLDSRFGGMVGGIYNFDYENVKESFFFSPMLILERQAMEIGREEESGFNFGFLLAAGKRFDLGQYSVANISYAPSVAWEWKRYGGDLRDKFFKNSNELRFNFLRFDILF